MHRFIILFSGFLLIFQSSLYSQVNPPQEEQTLRAIGKMEDGQREGQWAFYDENDQLVQTGSYDNGVREGLWLFYENKALRYEITYRNNKPSGNYKEYGVDGRLNSQGQFQDSLMVGTWTFFHPNGNPQLTGEMLNGKMHGLWKGYYADGKIYSEVYFSDGLREGPS